jgi:hypothetical protein
VRVAIILFAFTTSLHAATFTEHIRPLLEAQCFDCHGSEPDRKGGIDLQRFATEADVMQERSVWGSVLEKIESHQMPPPKRKTQPTNDDRAQLIAWVKDIAARPDIALGARDPGKPMLRRLTRLEYNNTIRDLFGLPIDVFMFAERVPITFKDIDLKAGRAQAAVREPGIKYPVLLKDAGLPTDNRAEHGFANRGEAMNLSPLLLERYLETARAITHSPKLEELSLAFRELIRDPARTAQVITPAGTEGFIVEAAPDFAPNFNVPDEARDGPVMMTTYQHRFGVRAGVAEGTAGVWDATARSHVIAAGEPIRVRFGVNREKALVIIPREDVWIAGFSTATETSGEGLFTNQVKEAKSLHLDLRIEGSTDSDGIVEIGLCGLSRKGEAGTLSITAQFTDDSGATLKHAMKKGEGIGNAFFGFRAPKGQHIHALDLDGREFSGSYALFDDLGFITERIELIKAEPAPEHRVSKRTQRKVARERLTDFIGAAFRRPATSQDIDLYEQVFTQSLADKNDFTSAMREAVAAVLTSPEFLYIGTDTIGSESVRALTDHELATRLAYFLWSAPPDGALRADADQGKLTERLDDHTYRMASHPLASELAESFAVQWLRLDQLTTAKPDPKLFKAFYSGPLNKTTLHGPMLVEALMLFRTVLAENRPILDFLHADYTWLNSDLAQLYGFESLLPAGAMKKGVGDDSTLVTAKKSSQWYRVQLPAGPRGGYLTMAGPLVVTSLPERTSPVKRGAWMLETLFNRPPQEPKIAFVLKDDDAKENAALTVRQRFEAHRNQGACYTCHIRIDPPGFALERFDAIGRWRTQDAGKPIDARAEWNGTAFEGPAAYKQLLARDPHEFIRGFIEHLLSYALGRKLEIYDLPAIEQIQAGAADSGYRIERILMEITRSYPFRHVRNG